MSRVDDELRAEIERDAAERANGSSPTAWPAPLAEAAFYGLPGDVVKAIAPQSEADPAALLVQYLAAFGNVVGRGPHYRVEDTEHHAAEYVALVGETSKARKGTSWGRIRRVYERVDAAWVMDKTAGGLSTGEGLIWEVHDPTWKRIKELDERRKPTGRWVDEQEDEGVFDKRLLVQEAELSRVLSVITRQGDTLSSTLRSLWDEGNAAARARTSRARTTGAHVSIAGHIPITELRTGLTRTEAANGFANRFLWVVVRRARSLPFGGRLDEHELHKLAADTADNVRAARALGEITMDADASELWVAAYDRLSEARPGLVGSITARGEAHVVRLALIYALTDASPAITAAHLRAALAVWDYSERSAAYIWGDAIGDAIADDILRELRQRQNGMTRTEIRQLLGGSYPADRIEAALALLRQHRLAWMTTEETGGRHAERWHAVTQEAAR